MPLVENSDFATLWLRAPGEGWRPRAVQQYFHDKWMPREILKRHPKLSKDEVREETQRYWAAPTTDRKSPALAAPEAS